jgi:glycosidase
METKLVIYQVLPRLFGNTTSANIKSGTIVENGCGKMSAFTTSVLDEIRRMGVNCIWFTGIIEHASQTAYPQHGIAADHPDIVKGQAGSPYAIRDYYDISPDIADNIPERHKEFDELVQRCHNAGLKIIIDFVPNHVARNYHSDSLPAGAVNLGEYDHAGTEFDPNNNFYYLPGQLFTPPVKQTGAESCYYEFPARATGNNCFTASPTTNDWYETIKLNYGIDYQSGNTNHFDPIPDTWYKMRNILLHWADKNIDGFRCDMAEMVPVQFWQWAIPAVKATHPDAIFIAEIYDTTRYHQYIHHGRFDYLYDKSGLYDTLRAIISHNHPASDITHIWQTLGDLQPHMLNFIENHDEQRIASTFFASCPLPARPAILVAAAINTGPVMIYSGQELGEPGMDSEGFSGQDGRTTIFDYWSPEKLRRWYNNGNPSDTQLTAAERDLRTFYTKILQLCNNSAAIREGRFFDLMYVNPAGNHFNPHRQFAWMRCSGNELILLVANFDAIDVEINIFIPENAFSYFNLHCKIFTSATDMITGQTTTASMSKNSSYPLKIGRHDVRIIRFSYSG